MSIVTFSELSQLQKKVAMVDGGFDPIHHGHIAYFKAAAELGYPVLCCLASDNYVSKKHKPLLTQSSRAAVIESIRYVDYVCINETTTATLLEKLQPRFYVKGKDWENRLPFEETSVCAKYNIEIIYLNTVLDSSSQILKKYLNL